MKRQILASNSNSLTNDDYISFIKQCHKSWAIFPAPNVDLIIEYTDDFKLNTLLNTQNEYIWGCLPERNDDEMKKFVEEDLGIHRYIIAHIRDNEVEGYKIVRL